MHQVFRKKVILYMSKINEICLLFSLMLYLQQTENNNGNAPNGDLQIHSDTSSSNSGQLDVLVKLVNIYTLLG